MDRSWTVDHIEEGIAAVQEGDGPPLHLPAWLLPDDVREGDILSVERRESRGTVTLRLRVDRDATRRALDASRAQVERMKGGDAGGDIQL